MFAFLAALFVVEASTRSPASLFTEIRDKLPWSSQTDAMVARAIIGVLALLVKGNVRNPPRWAEALRTVDDVFHKAPKTRMAIRMLSAAVQFVETREIGWCGTRLVALPFACLHVRFAMRSVSTSRTGFTAFPSTAR